MTRAATVTDYQPNAGYFDEDSVGTPSTIHMHDHHGGMTTPTVLGEPWHASPEHAHLPLHVPPSWSASVRQAPSAITRHGTVINEHGSVFHGHGGAATAAMGAPPSHVPLHYSVGNQGGHETMVVYARALPSASGNNHYVVDPGGGQRGGSITHQPVRGFFSFTSID